MSPSKEHMQCQSVSPSLIDLDLQHALCSQVWSIWSDSKLLLKLWVSAGLLPLGWEWVAASMKDLTNLLSSDCKMQRLTAELVQYGCDCCTGLKGKGRCTRGQSLQFTSHLCSSTHLCSWGLGTDWKGEIVSTMKWAFLPRLGIPQEQLENVIFFFFVLFLGKDVWST